MLYFLMYSLIGDVFTDGPTRYLYHYNMLSKLQTHLLIVSMSNLKWSSPIGHSSELLAWRKSTNKRKQKQKAMSNYHYSKWILRGTLGAFSTITHKLNTISRSSYTSLRLPTALVYSPPTVLPFSALSLFQFIESPLILVPRDHLPQGTTFTQCYHAPPSLPSLASQHFTSVSSPASS